MSEFLVRLAIIGGLALLAAGIGVIVGRRRRSTQPRARVEGLGFDGAVVAFTSTDCGNCKKVMRALSDLDVHVREVTFELEPGIFARAGVEGVPLVVVLRPDGSPDAQFAGAVRERRLRRALTRAGW